jgi:hypothetical protein
MDKVIKNYEEPLSKPMNTKQFFLYLKNKRKEKRHNKKNHNQAPAEHIHDETCLPQGENIAPQDIKVVSLAIVIDNIVVEVMRVQDSFSEILLNSPKFVVIDEEKDRPRIGWAYLDEKFSPLENIIHPGSITMRG